jgi:hypothetical protein
MNRTACCLVFLVLLGGPLSAQSSFYGGGIVAADVGSRGTIDLGSFPAAAGFFGWRFLDAWSIEFHFDRGFGKSPERERLEIYGHSTLQDRAGAGRAVLFTWKSRHTGRVGAAVSMGMSMRSFQTHTLTVTKDIPDDPYPARLGETYVNFGVGWTGGVLFPIALGGRWSVAPEARMTVGLTENSGYAQFYPGVRMMWGF